ncbi:MAG: hypothetical protein QXX30_00840 [Candidatus Aenigmatarchaeota archaeon]
MIELIKNYLKERRELKEKVKEFLAEKFAKNPYYDIYFKRKTYHLIRRYPVLYEFVEKYGIEEASYSKLLTLFEKEIKKIVKERKEDIYTYISNKERIENFLKDIFTDNDEVKIYGEAHPSILTKKYLEEYLGIEEYPIEVLDFTSKIIDNYVEEIEYIEKETYQDCDYVYSFGEYTFRLKKG